MSVHSPKLSLRSLFTRTRAESEAAQFGRDARADWRMVVLVFLFLNVLSVGMGLFVYRQIDKGELFLVDQKEAVPVRILNRFELERTLSFFEEKRSRFETVRHKPPATADPYISKTTPK